MTLLRTKILPVLAALTVSAALVAAVNPASAFADAPRQLGVYLPGGGGNAAALDEYASMVGRRPDIFLVFRNMGGPLLYSSEVNNLRARGETPMVTLEPYTSGGLASLPDIAGGNYDAYFRKEADMVRDTGMTVMIRFAHEMNLLSSDWGPNKDGNTGSAYVEAWRHIVTIFREEGATNVRWVWAPNVDYGGRPFSQFYPGDEWVDYVGLDGYNWGTSGGESESFVGFSKIFSSSYATITQLSSKPVIVTETASSETGGNKAAWIEEAFLETIPKKMPRVSAVIWFNENKERDWPVNSSQASLEAYRRVVASTLYGGNQAPVVKEEAPAVEELDVVPVVTPAPESGPASQPAPEAAPTNEPVPSSEPVRPHRGKGKGKRKAAAGRQHGRIGVTLRGRVTYRLSRRALVRIALHRKGRPPLVFSAEQNAGHKRVALAKLVGERRLSSGKYRVSVVAYSSTGSRSRPRQHGFRIVLPTKKRHAAA